MSRVLFCGVWRRAFLSLACTLRNPVFDAVGELGYGDGVSWVAEKGSGSFTAEVLCCVS
ncbi:hypothetical protein M758_11G120000 [Ceratodon purpureus]|nr:hypothetical protein M758_11G120000 [Ceratodon purpureus]